MSRLVPMILWGIFALAHASILVYVPPLLDQLIALVALEVVVGFLTWKTHRSLERRTIQRIIDLAETEERPRFASASAGRHV
jgi:hypothetical protein